MVALLVIFALSVAFKLNQSSIGHWDSVVPDSKMKNEGYLLGVPREARSDEWAVYTPLLLSQAANGFPVHNESVGPNNDPLVMSLPVKHFSTLLRPQNWGYFVFGIKRGFSFYWSFKLLFLFLSFFLLLIVLTKNSFWLSLFGSVWLYLTPYVQWWFSTTLPEMIISFSFIFLAFAYVLTAKKKLHVGIALALFIIFSFDFVLFFYPPYQVPLAFLLVLIMGVFLLEKITGGMSVQTVIQRGLLLGGALIFLGGIFYLFYTDASATIQAATNTIYPGNRSSPGGEISLGRLFSGFSLVPWGEQNFPARWSNAPEASNFLLLYPVIGAIYLRDRLLGIKNNPLIAIILILLSVLTVWIWIGMPLLIAKLTLLDLVPPNRALLGLGVAAIVVTVVFLAQRTDYESIKSNAKKRRLFNLYNIIIAAAIFIFSVLVAWSLRLDSPDYFRLRYLALIVLAIAGLSALLLWRKKTAFCILILAAAGLPPLLAHPGNEGITNPVVYGMGSIFNKEIFRFAEDVRTKDPQAKWVTYGNPTVANLFKAAGLNVLSGTSYTPRMSLMKSLDDDDNSFVYNRYGLLAFNETAVPGTNEISFTLPRFDLYSVAIDPCSPRLKDLGIKYFAFYYKISETKYSCLENHKLFEADNVAVYQRDDV